MTEENNETNEVVDEVVEEVKDPQGLLKSHNKLKEDVKSLREAHEALEAEKVKLVAERDSLNERLNSDPWKVKALKSEIKQALAATGLKDHERLMKFVDMEGLDFDEDGKLTGIEEKLANLKKELPEVFDARRVVGGRGDIFADTVATQTGDPLREKVKEAIGNR